MIQGHEVTRPAVPAEDMMQAFAYRHLVPAKELEVSVSGRNRAGPFLKILGTGPVRIPAGGTATVRIGAPSSAFADRFQFELNEPPDGVVIRSVSPTNEGAQMVLGSDAAKAKPGLKGNLIVSLFPGNTAAAPGKAKNQGNQRRAPVGTLPAIPFEIVAQ